MASRSTALNAIAREVALDTATGQYTIEVATHIPGIANKLPDDLSRLWAPEPHDFPTELRGIPESPASPRDPTFWRTARKAHRAGKAHGHRRRTSTGTMTTPPA